jgi:RNA polymerase sigma-70 factor (ECF subfamily)
VSHAAAQVYDRLLILRCQAGDEIALAELIARYSPGLRLYLRKLSGPREAADDLLQEVWVDVYRKIGTLHNPASFSAWLYRIARDKAFRELRRRHPAPLENDEAVIDEVDSEPGPSPEEAADVRVALDRLPIEQREVLVLRFIEDLSYEQIAEIIARPIGTVRSRIHYAKLALRAILQGGAFGKEQL